MTQTYLNGKITVSSLAAPTEEDLQNISQSSEDERRQMLTEAIDRGANSPISNATMDGIWQRALSRYKAKHAISS